MPSRRALAQILYGVQRALLLLVLAGCARPGPTASDTEQPQSVEVEETQSVPPGTGRPLIEQLGTSVPTLSGRPTADAAHYDTDVVEGGTLGIHP